MCHKIIIAVTLLLALNTGAFAQTVITCGGVDDTAMLNTAFATRGGNFCTTGICAITGQVTISPGATSSVPETVSLTTCGSLQAGSIPPTFVAKLGTTGISINARNLANSSIAHISIRGDLDTGWDMTGPSPQNHFTDVYVSGTWAGNNNNDTEFDHAYAGNFKICAPGGLVTMHNSYWYGGILDLCAQNAHIIDSGGSGIRLNLSTYSSGGLELDTDYLYADKASGYAVWNAGGKATVSLTSVNSMYVGPGKAAFAVKPGKFTSTGDQFIGIKPGN
jgi:hypothetical protein